MRQTTLNHIHDVYPDHYELYTDGSKSPDPVSNEKVGLGIYSSKDHIDADMSIRISDNTAITTAEIKAIDLALQRIKKEVVKGKCPTDKKNTHLFRFTERSRSSRVTKK